MRKLFLLAVLVVVATSCKDQAPAPSVTGKWAGQAQNWRFTVFLNQTGSDVSGNGTMTDDIESAALTIDGTFVGNTVSMTIDPEGFQSMNYTGPLGDKVITGTLNGSGFSNHAMTLVKQP